MVDANDSPVEQTTSRENHLTVLLDVQSGSVRVLDDDHQVVRRLLDETRNAQARGDLELLAGCAA